MNCIFLSLMCYWNNQTFSCYKFPQQIVFNSFWSVFSHELCITYKCFISVNTISSGQKHWRTSIRHFILQVSNFVCYVFAKHYMDCYIFAYFYTLLYTTYLDLFSFHIISDNKDLIEWIFCQCDLFLNLF